MRRGRSWGIGVAAAAVGALALAPIASAQPEMVTIGVSGKATNGYRYEMEATKFRGNDRVVSLELTRQNVSVIYVARDPKRLDRRAVVADFGELGRVSLHARGRWRKAGGSLPCFNYTTRFGGFRGAIRFDGESMFSRVRHERPFGYFERSEFGCGPKPRRRHARDEGSVVGTCASEPGPANGLFAIEPDPREPTMFLASSFERTPEMFILRSAYVEGAARNMYVSPDRAEASLRPPEPIYGRGRVADDRLTGRIRIALPGAGIVPLAPGVARIGGFDDFAVPKRCFPLIYLRQAGSDHAERFARAIGR